MGWLQKIQPTILYQESSIPYILLEDYVFLCHTNYFAYETPPVTEEYSIAFKYERNNLFKQSANYFKIKDFPAKIHCNDITHLSQNVEKATDFLKPDPKNIAIVNSGYCKKLKNSSLDDLYENLEEFDQRFVLVRQEINTNTRILDDICTSIFHENSNTNRTCSIIAHKVCDSDYRSFNWIKNIPDLEIVFFGFKNTELIDDFAKFFNSIGVEVSTSMS